MLSIKLFNSVVVNKDVKIHNILDLDTLKFGFILQPEVSVLPNLHTIIEYCRDMILSDAQFNQTFHKSWSKIEDSDTEELLRHQLMHYFTTYGFEAMGLYSDDTVYIPNEVLTIPEVVKIPLRVIKGVSQEEMINKCLVLLESGVALKSETIDDLLMLLGSLGKTFTRSDIDKIKNKEAKLKLSVIYNVLPNNNTEMLRMMIFKATDSTLIINDRETLTMITTSGLDISEMCMEYGLDKLSQSFLRYKRLFLTFKKAHKSNVPVVNKLRKLAITNHKPMAVDYLNNFVSLPKYTNKEVNEELDKVNNFRKIRLLYALHDRMNSPNNMLYKIRNGKSYAKSISNDPKPKGLDKKFSVVYKHLIDGLNLKGTKVLYPEGIEYVLPTTEKQFIGNFPSGTSIDIGEDAVVGIYWKNAGGAYDFDLGSIALEKVGWNSTYKNRDKTLLYSGDITTAPNGASECLYIKNSLSEPNLVLNNRFSGNVGAKYKFFVAKEKINKLSYNYMVDPNNILLQVDCVSNQSETNLGILIPTKTGVKFVLTDFNSGDTKTSYVSDQSEMIRDYLFHTYKSRISLRDVLRDAGCVFVTEDADIDLTVTNLDKSTILDLFISGES